MAQRMTQLCFTVSEKDYKMIRKEWEQFNDENGLELSIQKYMIKLVRDKTRERQLSTKE